MLHVDCIGVKYALKYIICVTDLLCVRVCGCDQRAWEAAADAVQPWATERKRLWSAATRTKATRGRDAKKANGKKKINKRERERERRYRKDKSGGEMEQGNEWKQNE